MSPTPLLCVMLFSLSLLFRGMSIREMPALRFSDATSPATTSALRLRENPLAICFAASNADAVSGIVEQAAGRWMSWSTGTVTSKRNTGMAYRPGRRRGGGCGARHRDELITRRVD